jgi:5-methylcytosine-specific restriction endonuclease McrA
MNLDIRVREKVRRRANFMCEFCGVSETGSGGELTIDHYKPKSKGGDNSPDNLLYCCIRCNQYKLDYWPENPGDVMLWNPHHETFEKHFLELSDGNLYPLTPTGDFSDQVKIKCTNFY